jgi:hypothetical protein
VKIGPRASAFGGVIDTDSLGEIDNTAPCVIALPAMYYENGALSHQFHRIWNDIAAVGEKDLPSTGGQGTSEPSPFGDIFVWSLVQF